IALPVPSFPISLLLSRFGRDGDSLRSGYPSMNERRTKARWAVAASLMPPQKRCAGVTAGTRGTVSEAGRRICIVGFPLGGLVGPPFSANSTHRLYSHRHRSTRFLGGESAAAQAPPGPN